VAAENTSYEAFSVADFDPTVARKKKQDASKSCFHSKELVMLCFYCKELVMLSVYRCKVELITN